MSKMQRLAAFEMRRTSPLCEKLTGILFLCLAVVSVVVLGRLAHQQAGEPSFDFRYFWLAGQMWADGVSPYGATFHETGQRLITEGHIPVIWPYPPSTWALFFWLGYFDFAEAWKIWLALKISAVLMASAVLAVALPLDRMPGFAAQSLRLTRFGFFCAHLAIMALLEATLLDLFSGQTAAFIYLGAAFLIAGLSWQNKMLAAAGLAVVMMKPQIGAVFALGLMLYGREGLGLVFRAALISVLLIVPPAIIEPNVVFDWLAAVAGYDGAHFANTVAMMSGLRHLVWLLSGVDMGNLAAMVLTLVAGAAVALQFRFQTPADDRAWCLSAVDLMIVECVLVLALSPLHLYDFVLVGFGFLCLLNLSGLRLLLGVAGAALVVRPSDLNVWIYGLGEVTLFPGTTFATIGMMILLVVVVWSRKRTQSPALPLKRP